MRNLLYIIRNLFTKGIHVKQVNSTVSVCVKSPLDKRLKEAVNADSGFQSY